MSAAAAKSAFMWLADDAGVVAASPDQTTYGGRAARAAERRVDELIGCPQGGVRVQRLEFVPAKILEQTPRFDPSAP